MPLYILLKRDEHKLYSTSETYSEQVKQSTKVDGDDSSEQTLLIVLLRKQKKSNNFLSRLNSSLLQCEFALEWRDPLNESIQNCIRKITYFVIF